MTTNAPQDDDKRHAGNVGADACLTKPFDPANMIRVIRQLTGTTPAIC
jgi:CheY-like chemotaxis protein